MLIIVGVILFVFLVAIHEFGHMIAAKRNGVEVKEYGIGFPPRLFGKRFSEDGTLYTLNAIPLGGFVRLKGEAAADDEPDSFGAASFWVQAKILMAGVVMNLAVAFGLFLLLAFVGVPQQIPNQFTVAQDAHTQPAQTKVIQVVEDSPAAAQTELAVGDQIVSLDGQNINSREALIEYTKDRANQEVQVTYRHQDQVRTQTVTLTERDGRGFLGVAPFTLSEQTRYTWSAPIVAAGLTVQSTQLTFEALGGVADAFVSSDKGVKETAVGGPVAIFAIVQNVNRLGAFNLLIFFMATISVALAAFNALPIPALDGGRLAVIGLFKAWGRKLTEPIESAINGIGVILVLTLAVFIIVIDVQRFFGSFAREVKLFFTNLL